MRGRRQKCEGGVGGRGGVWGWVRGLPLAAAVVGAGGERRERAKLLQAWQDRGGLYEVLHPLAYPS